MLNSFNQFSSSTILINLTRIFNVVLDLPDQITSKTSHLHRSQVDFRLLLENQSTPSTYSHLIDLRLYTTKHIHVLKYQLLTFGNNILSADFFIKMVISISSFFRIEFRFFCPRSNRLKPAYIKRMN